MLLSKNSQKQPNAKVLAQLYTSISKVVNLTKKTKTEHTFKELTFIT